MTKIIKYDEREELIQKVAAKISSALITALDGRETITFAVPGGTTPGPILEKLSEFYLDWARVNVILGDERWVPHSHERSNTRLIMKTLFKNEAKKARFIPMYADFASPEEGILHINKYIEPNLPLSVALLGMGGRYAHSISFSGIKKFEAGFK